MSFLLLSSLWCSCLSDKTGRNVVVLWFWGWGNEHHNAWRRQLSRDLARASSWEAGCHCCCIAGTRGVRSSLSVVSRVIRRRNADKGAKVKPCWRRRLVELFVGTVGPLWIVARACCVRVLCGVGIRGYWRRHLCQGKHLLLWVLCLCTRWQHVRQRIVVNAPASCDTMIDLMAER